MQAITYSISPPRWVACTLLGKVWRSVWWGPLAGLSLDDIQPQPFPGGDWVRLRPRLGGICGSDLGLVQGGTPDSFGKGLVIQPIVVGHENVSEVIERGAEAEDVLDGRYNVEPVLSCRPRGKEELCPSCRAGQFASCWSTAETEPFGFSVGYSGRVGGSWSESFIAHRSQLIPVPEDLSDEQAVLVDPLASSVHAVLRRPPAETDRDVLVFGCGLIGLGIVEFLQAQGFDGRLFAVARYEFQRRLALEMGADEVWIGRDLVDRDIIHRIADVYDLPVVKGSAGKPIVFGGVDLVYDAVGSRTTVEDSLRILRPQGTLALVGMGHPRWVDWDPVPHKQLWIVGSHGRALEDWRGDRVHTYRVVHDLMAEGHFPADRLLTHTWPLEEYRDALSVLTNKAPHEAVHGAFRVAAT